jgi:hypothetical protein
MKIRLLVPLLSITTVILFAAGASNSSDLGGSANCKFSDSDLPLLFKQLFICEQKSLGKKPKIGKSLRVHNAIGDPRHGTFGIIGSQKHKMIECLVNDYGWEQLAPPKWKADVVRPPFPCNIFDKRGFSIVTPTGKRKWEVIASNPQMLVLVAALDVNRRHTGALLVHSVKFADHDVADLKSLMQLASKIHKGEWAEPRYESCHIQGRGGQFRNQNAAEYEGSCIDTVASKHFGSQLRVHFELVYFLHPQSNKYVIRLVNSERLPTGSERADLSDDIRLFRDSFEFRDLPPEMKQ